MHCDRSLGVLRLLHEEDQRQHAGEDDPACECILDARVEAPDFSGSPATAGDFQLCVLCG